ncbi:hypothetical protein [Legionella brunensis]|uniref:Dot/Icm T4SS effector n=1 Tax=Legionella brunensis TaxID=29422 RepID=A0A0W0S4C8_9GAMM|nr:hypothetical protein [Legionella brunensis]KTC78307.1 Dot/Icm T4SS effector [Legionella brunensis]
MSLIIAIKQDLSTWLQYRITDLETYSSEIMSFRILKEGFLRENDNILSRLETLNKSIDEHQATPNAKAIHLLINSYHQVLHKTHTPESRAFISSLDKLLKTMSRQTTDAIVSQMSKEFVDTIISHCLAGLNSDDKSYDYACRHLLTSLCQLQSASNHQTLERIKAYLGQQDLNLLGEKQLILIASDILSGTEKDLTTSTLNGVWIQRLLTSPRFIAASNPKVIQSLVDRYRFISLTLKQDEFERLNQWLKTKLAFYDHHQQSLTRVEKSILDSPKRREYLLKKRERLLSFRADDSIRALFNQLEDNCIELRKDAPETADSALDVLYSHYNSSLTSLRSDFLFKVADFIVNRASRNRGDIDIAQDTLLGWLRRYLPYKNFEQNELARKSQVSLYNAEGEKIGFINEANQAMTFIDDEPCSLLETQGMCPGISLYDSNRCVMGTLMPSGEVKRENLFQKSTSALLIAKVLTEQLTQSPAALELLMTDIFTEHTLEQLYANSETEKHPWIETQISLHFLEKQQPKETVSYRTETLSPIKAPKNIGLFSKTRNTQETTLESQTGLVTG